MMISLRRSPTWIGSAILAILLFSSGVFMDRTAAQPKIPLPVGGGNSAELSSIKFVDNGNFRRIISVARDCIDDKEWKQAVQALQAVLNEKQDYTVRVIERDPANPKNEITQL